MSIKRQPRSSKFKFQVALEATKGVKTINQLASETGLNPGQISHWKGQLLEKGSSLFETGIQGKRSEKGNKKQSCMNKSGDSRWNWSG